MLKDVTNYIKNMGKSIGYTAIDISAETAPAMKSFVDTNKEFLKDIYVNTKDPRALFKKTKGLVTGSKIYEAADLGLKAAMEDIKTGNFYNKARENEYNEKYGGLGGSDIDDIGDFMTRDEDDGSFSSLEITDGEREICNTVDAAVKASADLTSTTIAKSAQYMGNVTKSSTNAIIVQNERLFGNLSNRIVAMHGGINDLYKLHAKSIEGFSKMNSEFYENTTNLMRESNAMLKEILEMQRNMYKAEQNKAKVKVNYSDITSGGMPDLKEYSKVIKKNFKGIMDSFGGGMLNSLGDGNLLATFVSSPLKFIPELIVRGMIPAAIASNMKELDKSLSGVFGTAISRFNKMAKSDENGILKYIGKLFGIDSNVKSSIDTGNYNKGAVPFDGITRKSIVEVIPGHLRRIEAILSGLGDERVYDYDKGKWTTASKIKSSFDSIEKQYRDGAFSDMRNYAKRYVKKAGFSSAQERKFWEDFETFTKQVYNDHGALPSNLRKMKKDNYGGYSVADENFAIIKDILTTMKKSDVMSISGNVLEARNKHNKAMIDAESSASAIINYLFDGSEMKNTNKKFKIKDGIATGLASAINIANVTDNLGNNVFFYLQNILKSLKWQELNWGYQSTGNYKNKFKYKNINDSYWNSLVNNNSSSNNRDKNISSDQRIMEAAIAGHNAGYILGGYDDDALEDSRRKLREANILVNIHDEDALRKEYRDKKYGRFYKEQDDLDMGRYSHGKHGKGIVTRLREAGTLMDKFNVISEGVKDFAKSPASLLATVLDKANQSIFSFFYQDPIYDEEGNKIKGFMDLMASKLKTTFNKFNKFLDDHILDPLKKKLGVDSLGDLFDKMLKPFGLDKEARKEKWNNLTREGTFLGDFIKGFKDEWLTTKTAAGNTIKTAVKETYGNAADHLFGTKFSSYGMNKFKDKKKSESLRRTMMAYLADTASLNREEFKASGRIGEYESIVDVMMTNEAEVANAIAWGRKNKKRVKGISREFATDSGEVAPQSNIGTFARGARMITKAGLTMISPGEAIIPANLNPFNPDRDRVDLNKQLKNEKRLKSNFINNLRNNIGLKATGDDGTGASIAQSKPLAKEAVDTVTRGATETVTRIFLGDSKQSKAFKEATTEIKEKIKGYLPKMAVSGLIGGGVGLLTGIGGPLLGAVAGASVGLLQKSDKMQNWLFGEMAEENGEQVRQGGVISKKTQQAIKKYLPDMKNFGIAGTLGGLITPLGPVGGLMVGSALAYVKNNEKFANILYGELNEKTGVRNGGIFDKAHMDELKKKAPNMLGGAALGLLFGPGGGILTKAALGSAVGLLTTTDGFKSFLFGEKDSETGERTGGIVGGLHDHFIEPLKEFGKSIKDNIDGFIKKDLLEPIRNAIQPLATELSYAIKNAIMFIPNLFSTFMQDHITGPLSNWISEKIFNPLGKISKTLLKAPIKLAKTVISTPFKAIGALGNMYRQKQIMQGRADYMTAEERIEWREQHKVRGVLAKLKIPGAAGFSGHMDKYRSTDEALVNMDAEQISAIRGTLLQYINGGKGLSNNIKKAKREIFNAVNKYFNDKGTFLFIGKNTRKKILDAINKERFDEAMHLIYKAKGKGGKPIPAEERDALLEELTPLIKEYELLKKSQNDTASLGKAELADLIRKSGVKNFKGSEKEAKRLLSLVNSEYNRYSNSGAFDNKESDDENITNEALNSQTNALVAAIKELGDRFEKIMNVSNLDGMREESIDEMNTAIDNWNRSKTEDGTSSKKRKRRKKKKSSTPTVVSEGEAIVDTIEDSVETRAFGKLGTLFSSAKDKMSAKFKHINLFGKDSKEGMQLKIKGSQENERQNLMTAGILKVGEILQSWRNKHDKDKEDEEKGKKGFWGKVLRGLIIGGKVIGTIGATGLAAGLYKNYVHPVMTSVFNNHIKPWWTETALPAIKESAFGKAIIRGMDYVTGSGEFAESGGLRGTISSGIDWLLGRGEYKGKGLLNKAKGFLMNTIVPNMFTGLEWIIGDLAPKILSGLFASLPKLLGAAVKGIGNFFKMSISSLTSKDIKTFDANDFEIQYSGNTYKSSNIASGGNKSVLSQWGLNKPTSYQTSAGTVKISGIDSNNAVIEPVLNTNVSPEDYYVNEGGRTNGGAAAEALVRGSLTKGGKLIKTFAKGGIGNSLLKNTIGRLGKTGKLVSGTVTGSANLFTKASSGINKLLRKGITKIGLDPTKWLGEEIIEESTEKGAKKGIFSKFKDIIAKATGKNLVEEGAEEVVEAGTENVVKKGAQSAAENTAQTLGEKVLKKRVVEETTEKGAKGIIKQISEFVKEKFTKFIMNNAVIKAVKNSLKAAGKEATEKAAKKAAKEMGENILKKLLKNLAEAAGKAVGKALTKLTASVASAGILTIAFIVADFVAGMAKANTILGVTKESGGTTFLEKLLAGLVNAITENLTFGLLPANIIVDIVIEYVCPVLSIDTSKLQARRDEALKEIEKWNAEHPDDQYDSVEDYNKKDKWYTKAWKGVKNFFSGKGSDDKDQKELDRIVKSSSASSRSSGYGISAKDRLAPSYGMGSGKHYSQYDSKYANISYNSSADTVKQTIKDSGCGPVAAAQVMSHYGDDKANPVNAARYAISNGYKELNGGTMPEFFRDYLADNNINTELLTDIKSMVTRIGNGQPTILMGTDSANSKTTPYGTTPHYVVATGFDRNGNIIIQNPESNVGNTKYHAGDVLSRSSIAIGTSYNTARFGKGSGNKNWRRLLNNIPRYGRASSDLYAVKLSSDYIGKYVKKFESGSKGSFSLTQCGYDWGLSCGSYQLTLRWGNCISFLKKYFPEEASHLYFNSGRDDVKSKGWPGGDYCSSPELVKQVWNRCLKAVGDDVFFSYEWEFIKNRYYDRACEKLSDIFNPNRHSRAMQECIWSWAVHRGVSGCNSGFRMAISNTNITDPQKCDEAVLLKACYDYRYNDFNQNSRYGTGSNSERAELAKIIGKSPITSQGFTLSRTASAGNSDDINAFMDESAINETNSSFSNVIDAIGNVFKNTKVYKLYESIFGSSKNNDEDEGYKYTEEEINQQSARNLHEELLSSGYISKDSKYYLTKGWYTKADYDNLLKIKTEQQSHYDKLALKEKQNHSETSGPGHRASSSSSSTSPEVFTAPRTDVTYYSTKDLNKQVEKPNLAKDIYEWLLPYNNANNDPVYKALFGKGTNKSSGNAKINNTIRQIISPSVYTNKDVPRIQNANKSFSYKLNNPSINNNTPSIKITKTSGHGTSIINNSTDYRIILAAIIEILNVIADNTGAIQKIANLLSEKLNIDTSDIKPNHSVIESKAKLRSKLQNLKLNDSGTSDSDLVSLINSMSAIASA